MTVKTIEGVTGGAALARLHAEFVVPVVMARILRGEEELDDVAEYAMNEIMGELPPDTALLCIALCSQQVAAHLHHLPIARTLRIMADLVVNEYVPVCLAAESGNEPAKAELAALLSRVPEDLEALADLLGATIGELDETRLTAAILCDILREQARACKDIAEADLAGPAFPDVTLSAAVPAPAAARAEHASRPAPVVCRGNVIPFPGSR